MTCDARLELNAAVLRMILWGMQLGDATHRKAMSLQLTDMAMAGSVVVLIDLLVPRRLSPIP